MGHRDIKTTQIYADYQPSPTEQELVDRAFVPLDEGIRVIRRPFLRMRWAFRKSQPPAGVQGRGCDVGPRAG
jgi:hypothetical protein